MAREGSGGTGRGNAFTQFYRWIFGIGYERNIGGAERTIRYTLGALLVLAGIATVLVPVIGNPLMNAVAAVILIVGGAYQIYEARVQYCPLNHTFERSTYDER